LESNIWRVYGPYGMQVLGIDLIESPSLVQNWGNSKGITYPLLIDPSYAVWNQYGMGYIPHNTLLDTSMKVLYTYYGYEEQTLLNLINNYYSPVYPQNVSVNSVFLHLGTDSLTINATMVNPDNHNATMEAIITSVDSTYADSIAMFDDGNHDDGQAGDNLFGGYLPPLSVENEFMVGVKTYDQDFNVPVFMPDKARFTTIGPVAVDGYTLITRVGSRFYYKISLRNNGSVQAAENVSAQFSTQDPYVIGILNGYQSFGNIAAGQTAISSSNLGINTSNMPAGHIVQFDVDIYSNGNFYWSDSGDVLVGIETVSQQVPESYSLGQNYPNPFNPSTTIAFSIPQTEFVTLKVYNTVGEEVASLVSKQLPAGTYQSSWNAEGFASGVYYYRLEAGKFMQIKKLLLLK